MDEYDGIRPTGSGIEGPSVSVSGIQGSSVSTINKFRPPPGFMDDQVQDDSGIAAMAPELMLTKLRAQAGPWHGLAKFLPVLASRGWDASAVDGETGITPAAQNKMLVASTVYDSLVGGGAPQALLDVFGAPGGEDLLYPFRFLGAQARLDAATYIVANNLNETVRASHCSMQHAAYSRTCTE